MGCRLCTDLDFSGDVNLMLAISCICKYLCLESGLNVVAITIIKLCLAKLCLRIVCLALSFRMEVTRQNSGLSYLNRL